MCCDLLNKVQSVWIGKVSNGQENMLGRVIFILYVCFPWLRLFQWLCLMHGSPQGIQDRRYWQKICFKTVCCKLLLCNLSVQILLSFLFTFVMLTVDSWLKQLHSCPHKAVCSLYYKHGAEKTLTRPGIEPRTFSVQA